MSDTRPCRLFCCVRTLNHLTREGTGKVTDAWKQCIARAYYSGTNMLKLSASSPKVAATKISACLGMDSLSTWHVRGPCDGETARLRTVACLKPKTLWSVPTVASVVQLVSDASQPPGDARTAPASFATAQREPDRDRCYRAALKG